MACDKKLDDDDDDNNSTADATLSVYFCMFVRST
jgi:hypothetical protein